MPLLYGMAQALKDNPGLHREFARLSHTLETDHKKYLTLLFAAMGKEELISVKNYLDRETAGYFKKAIENNPWQFSEPYLKDEINAFWMEFFFTGKKEPLLKIANQLQNRPTMTAKQAKEKKGALSPFEERKLKNFFSASQAAWSIRENASKHNLVFFYLEAMLENGEFADPTAALKIQKILLQTASAAANK